MAYDPHEEAQGCVNELFYRYGPTPQDIRTSDVEYVTETIERCLREAYQAGLRAEH